MPGAFCHGIVKNQQGFATEPFHIISNLIPALVNSAESPVIFVRFAA
jgi:hypothetical protein